MLVAAIYRVSTERQESIPLQRAAVREFVARRPGWELVREYAEEGVSGYKVSAEERDVLQQALRDARAGLWQALVVFKADRLSRSSFEYPIVIDRFRRMGCQVWSVTDAPGGRLLALDTQMDKFVRFLEGWQAETESRNTSIRVTEAMTQLARQGRWSGGPPPFGYRLNPTRRPRSDAPALVVDPTEAGVIRLMAELYLERRMGCLPIAQELNRRAIPNPTGRPWDDQRVRRILQNPIIAGLPAYGRNQPAGRGFTRKNPYDLSAFILPRDEAGSLRPVPEYQIIALDRWLQLVAAMQTARAPAHTGMPRHTVPARTRAADALLTGLLYCGHCGARLSADGDGRRITYICRTHARRGRAFCDGQRTYGARSLDEAVREQLRKILAEMEPGPLHQALLRGDGPPPIHKELARAERILEGWLTRLDAFLADPEASPFSEEILTAKIREARSRRDALCQGRLDAPKGLPPDRIDALAKATPLWWAGFEAAPPADRKLFLRELIDRIIVRRDGVEVVLRG